ncbi:hypothetical protein NRB_15010 [Novosphingobium sp. 11B]
MAPPLVPAVCENRRGGDAKHRERGKGYGGTRTQHLHREKPYPARTVRAAQVTDRTPLMLSYA